MTDRMDAFDEEFQELLSKYGFTGVAVMDYDNNQRFHGWSFAGHKKDLTTLYIAVTNNKDIVKVTESCL